MKKSLVALTVVASLVIMGACSKNDSDGPANNTGLDTLSGEIKTSRTLESGHTYYIKGFAVVNNNAVLTIKPGVIIKAIKGTKACLIITRGAKIMAEGTATNPIVFTSNQAAGARATADWGGIVLLGKAKVNSSFGGTASRRQVEGFTTDEATTLGDNIVGGGDDDNDNSGIMKYVRIEFGGIALSTTANSELNSLTFVGVGRGTTIDYIQASFGGDDAFEWFGGTVNAKHLVSYRTLDDDFDTDNGFTGRVQFGLSIRDKDISDFGNPTGSSNCFESDNDASGTDNTPLTAPIFSNMTVVGPLAYTATANMPANNVYKRGAHIRVNSRMSLYNSVVVGFPTGILVEGDKSVAALSLTSGDYLDIRNTYVGVVSGNKLEAKPLTGTFDIATWFATSRNNSTAETDIAAYKFASITAGADPKTIDARPVAGSPLLGKAAFTAGKSNDAFFTKTVTYVGAFDVADTWMNSWTNMDPKNTTY